MHYSTESHQQMSLFQQIKIKLNLKFYSKILRIMTYYDCFKIDLVHLLYFTEEINNFVCLSCWTRIELTEVHRVWWECDWRKKKNDFFSASINSPAQVQGSAIIIIIFFPSLTLVALISLIIMIYNFIILSGACLMVQINCPRIVAVFFCLHML